MPAQLELMSGPALQAVIRGAQGAYRAFSAKHTVGTAAVEIAYVPQAAKGEDCNPELQ